MSVTQIGTNIDATSNWTSGVVERKQSYDWSLQIIPTGLTKDYLLTIEVSNNNTDWSVYKLDAEKIDYTINEFIFDDTFPCEQIRIFYDANGNTAGTLDFIINLKIK